MTRAPAPDLPPLDEHKFPLESISSHKESEPISSKDSVCARGGRPGPLPRSIAEQGGPFVTVCLFTVHDGKGDEVLEMLRKVHKETDEKELSVYSHRVLRGRYEDDADTFSIIMEYDNPLAFHTHYFNSAFQAMIQSEYKVSKLRMSFFRELESGEGNFM